MRPFGDQGCLNSLVHLDMEVGPGAEANIARLTHNISPQHLVSLLDPCAVSLYVDVLDKHATCHLDEH